MAPKGLLLNERKQYLNFVISLKNIFEKFLMKFVSTVLPRCGLVTQHRNVSLKYENCKVSTNLDVQI